MTMTPGVRKFALTVHVVASVGWLGAVVAFLGLAVTGLTSDDEQTIRAAYVLAEPITWYVLVPLALASLLSGLVQSLGTTWGLFRHYWVLYKLVLNVVAVAVLLLFTRTVGQFARIAEGGADIGALRSPAFVLHAGAALLVLLVATVLAVYKPRGMTRYGRKLG
jgi:uncharacterized membrane protein